MKYLVTGYITISVSVEVEADSPKAARALARDAPMMTLCGQCAHGCPDEWSTSGELDGEVRIRAADAME